VQTGLGRTGKMFCWQHEDARPDAMVLGKALGGGVMPVSAVVGRREVMDAIRPGEHGSTFGGSPLACAAGLAAIEAYRDGNLIKRSATLGANMRNTLRGALEGVAVVRDIRGLGLMIAVELRTKVAPVLKSLMLNHGVIALPAGPTVLRLLPPLVITEKEIDFGVQAIAKAIKELPPSPDGLRRDKA
jgi:acetylornithine/succinyldiaminopimelate/putrescine aminotransferase